MAGMELISCIASLGDIGRLLIDERDRQKTAAIQIEFSNKLIETQSHVAQLLGTVIEQQRLIAILEQSVRDLEADKAEKERYRLTKLGSQGQFFVYVLNGEPEPGQAHAKGSHFVCQPCFDAGKKAVLIGNDIGWWQCPLCKVGAQVEPDTTDYTVLARRSYMDGF